MHKLFLAAAALAAVSSPATAGVVYSNDFNSENGGSSALNYNGFSGLTVTNGTVDLVRSGDFGITCAGGSGSCVDLDGSTSDAGITSSNSFSFNAGDRVELSFLFSGNQRGVLPDDFFRTRFVFGSAIDATFGSESTTFGTLNFGTFNTDSFRLDIFNIPPNFAMTDMTFFFRAHDAGAVNFSFEDFGNDNVGVIIDDVSLSIGAVPEPSTWALMILGFGAVGTAARRRRKAVRPAFA